MNGPLYVRGMTLRLRRRPRDMPPTVTVRRVLAQLDPQRGWRYLCIYDAGWTDRLAIWDETDLEEAV